jgi:hypothetical protein
MSVIGGDIRGKKIEEDIPVYPASILLVSVGNR